MPRFSGTAAALFAVLLLCFSALSAEPLQRLSGGESTDGLNLSAIRVGEHQGFTRIVFDVTYWQGYGKPQAGKPADKAGHYTFTLHPDLSIEAELAGFRSTTTAIPSLPKGGIIRTIKRLSGEEYGDDSAVFYRITLRRNARLKAFTLKDPARIVLDVYE